MFKISPSTFFDKAMSPSKELPASFLFQVFDSTGRKASSCAHASLDHLSWLSQRSGPVVIRVIASSGDAFGTLSQHPLIPYISLSIARWYGKSYC